MLSIIRANKIIIGLSLTVVVGAAGMLFGLARGNAAADQVEHLIGSELSSRRTITKAEVAFERAGVAFAEFSKTRDVSLAEQAIAQFSEISEALEHCGDGLNAPDINSARDEALRFTRDARSAFIVLKGLYEERGLSEKEGLEGRLRASVHAVEGALKEVDNHELLAILLMCRRYEKDFIKREADKYIGRVQKYADKFMTVARDAEIDENLKIQFGKFIENYKSAFTALAQKTLLINQEYATFAKHRQALRSCLQGLVQTIESRFGSQRDALSADQAATSRILLIAVFVVIVVGILAALFVLRAVLTPMRACIDTITLVAKGDLRHRLDENRQDEFGKLAKAVNQFLENIGEIISTLKTTSEELVGTASSLRSGSDLLKGSAESSLTSCEEANEDGRTVSKTMETVTSSTVEFSSSIDEISTNAQEAVRIASAAATMATETNESIGRLNESSERISIVVKVISSIAEQTSLLALNATIEAARAGESGRGFAVVATEVKELAAETARATEEIGTMVAEVRANTEESVGRIGQFTEVINTISQTQTTIAAAVEEQAVTVRDITSNIGRTSELTSAMSKRIGGASSEVAATVDEAESLQGTASSLDDAALRLQQSASGLQV